MADQEKPPKDFWDKADVVGKLISGLLLALIALFLKTGTERISSSIQTGNLVQSLISDLTTKDIKSRRDLALIALNRSVGHDKDLLVAEIAERILMESDEESRLGTKPFEILQERDPDRAQKAKDKIKEDGEAKVSTQKYRGALVSEPDPAMPPKPSPKEVPIEARLLARVSANVVYIQFNGEENRKLAEELRSSLKKQGFVAPGVEKVDRDYESNIRFFYTNDHEKAREVASLVDNFLKEKGIHKQLKLQDMAGRDFKSPQGQIEVWLNLNKP